MNSHLTRSNASNLMTIDPAQKPINPAQTPHNYLSIQQLLGFDPYTKEKSGYTFNPAHPKNYIARRPKGLQYPPNYKPLSLFNIHNISNKIQPTENVVNTKKGGGPLPLRFFDVNAEHPSADAGNDLLNTSGRLVRPVIGGKHSGKRSRRHTKRSKRSKRTKKTMKGGFFPSIMEPFVLGCSKYIAPLAGLAAYKLLHNPTKKRSNARK